jgi:uncharacterized membrane protein YobD (UPF0266 family)
MHIPKLARRIVTDAAGYGLIILSVLTGWLPGPGGIPLFLAGLGLLSIHNAWAKKLLVYFKENGLKLLAVIFPENTWIKALHDIFVGILCIAIVVIIIKTDSVAALAVVVVLGALAVVDILYNRNRWATLTKKKQK